MWEVRRGRPAGSSRSLLPRLSRQPRRTVVLRIVWLCGLFAGSHAHWLDARAQSGHQTQVAIDFLNDPNYAWHVRFLLQKAGGRGQWISTPDDEVSLDTSHSVTCSQQLGAGAGSRCSLALQPCGRRGHGRWRCGLDCGRGGRTSSVDLQRPCQRELWRESRLRHCGKRGVNGDPRRVCLSAGRPKAGPLPNV